MEYKYGLLVGEVSSQEPMVLAPPPEHLPDPKVLILQFVIFLPVLFYNLHPTFKWAPLGRPPVNVFCAMLAVLLGTISEKEAFEAIDHATLMFLIGMMLIAAYLEKKQFLEKLAEVTFKKRGPVSLLILTSFVSGLLAMLITNDGVCMLITPLVVKLCIEKNIDPFPFLVAICTSANIGSGAVLSGNPQNILIGHLSQKYLANQISWLEFAGLCLPAALVGLLLNIALLLLYYRGQITRPNRQVVYQIIASEFDVEPEPTTTKGKILNRMQQVLTSLIMIMFMITFALGFSVEVITLLGSIFLVVVDTVIEKDIEVPKKLFRAIQWDVIMVFGALFIVVHTFNQTQIPRYLWSSCYSLMRLSYTGPSFFSIVLILLSTLVSNVPVVLMVAPEMKSKLAWIVLSWAITVGGNFTIISSAANIIVDEKANSMCPQLRLGSWNYFKFGALSTLIVTLTGTYLIMAIGLLFHYHLDV